MHPRTPRIKKGGRKQAPVGGGGPRLFPLQHRGNAHAGGGSALCAVGRWADALGQGDGVQPCSQRGGAAGQGPQLRRLARGWRGCGRPGPRPRPRPGPCRGRGPVQQPGDGMLHARTSRMTHRLRRGLGVKPHVQQLPHDGGGGGPPRHGALGTAFTGPSPARPSAQMKSNYHAAHLESHCQGAPAAHRGPLLAARPSRSAGPRLADGMQCAACWVAQSVIVACNVHMRFLPGVRWLWVGSRGSVRAESRWHDGPQDHLAQAGFPATPGRAGHARRQLRRGRRFTPLASWRAVSSRTRQSGDNPWW